MVRTEMTSPQCSIMLRTYAADDPLGWDQVIDRARAADEAGIDRVVMSDHVIFGENLAAYADPAKGGSRGGKQPTGPDGHWLDPLTMIAYLAGLTHRVRLGTSILIAALRRPVVLAKMAATIDVLSHGRLDLGVGVGWQREEYDAAGLQYERRGRLLDHTLEVCNVLWREQIARYAGEGLAFDRIHQMPKPVQPNGIPIWVSGTVNPRAMERLAQFGSGWIPWGEDAQNVATGIEKMRSAVAALGRDPSDLGVVGTVSMTRGSDGGPNVEATMAGVPALVDAGVTDIRFLPQVPRERSEATEFLTDLVAQFRAVIA